jgi:hypothetical protein
MIDLATYHYKHKPEVMLARFFNTKPYHLVYTYLKEKGLTDNQITQRTKPHRGSPGVAQVHMLVFIEYLKWAEPQKYYAVLDRGLTNAKATT